MNDRVMAGHWDQNRYLIYFDEVPADALRSTLLENKASLKISIGMSYSPPPEAMLDGRRLGRSALDPGSPSSLSISTNLREAEMPAKLMSDFRQAQRRPVTIEGAFKACDELRRGKRASPG